MTAAVDCGTANITILAVFVLALTGSLTPVLYASPARHVRVLRFGNAFAAGFLVAAALVHILPEALIAISENTTTEYPIGGLFSVIGICAVFVLDVIARQLQASSSKTLPVHSHGGNIRAHSPVIAIALAASLSFHSFLEGISLGVNLQDSTSFTAISIAILVHKLFAALALGSALTVTADGDPQLQKRAVYVCVFFASVTPAGAWSGMALLDLLPDHMGGFLVPAMNVLSAGVFIYVALVELLADEFRYASKGEYTDLNPDDSLPSMAIFVLAAAAMSVLAVWT